MQDEKKNEPMQVCDETCVNVRASDRVKTEGTDKIKINVKMQVCKA